MGHGVEEMLNNFRFYLGTHRPAWVKYSPFPLFVSFRCLPQVASLWEPNCCWALDSGGFSELSLFGKWTIPRNYYAERVSKLKRLDFASIQDWMCEPFILKKTGKTVKEHQWLTVVSYIELCAIAPEVNWLPVIQGFTHDEYFQCIRLYEECGIDLTTKPLVGLGSVCRRQATQEIADLVKDLYSIGLKLHGFGVKQGGLVKCFKYLKSADSLAWSFRGRKSTPLPGCSHKNCANCYKFAVLWRKQLLTRLLHV